MSNKKLQLVFGLVLSAFVWMMGACASAVSFKIDLDSSSSVVRPEYIRRNMTPIHFKDNWNDFIWFIYFANGVVEDVEISAENIPDKYIVQAGAEKLECFQKVNWFYYSAERGERLWSLNTGFFGVEFSGGIYTRCTKIGYADALAKCAVDYDNENEREDCEKEAREKYADTHWYYGMITHTYNWQVFALVAWTDYGSGDGWWIDVDDSALEASLMRFDNKYPVGFIYDTNWWAGFVWCRVNDWGSTTSILASFHLEKSWDKLFFLSWDGVWTDLLPLDCSDMWSALNSLIWVIVDGLVWINRDSRDLGIQWNQSNEKMQYFWSVDINNMQLINYARQRAEILCRWKWKSYNGSIDTSKSLNCFSGSSVDKIEARTWTTIIAKWVDVQVAPMSDFANDGNYDIFIDSGNLIIDDKAVHDLKVFKRNWFISNTGLEQFKYNVYTGAWGNNKAYSWEEVAAGKFIRWNFIVNWKIKQLDEDLDNVYFIYWKMTSKDTVDDLKNVFKWKCYSNWSGSDGTPCPWWRSGWNNPYENASLVIIDQNYPSPLYD